MKFDENDEIDFVQSSAFFPFSHTSLLRTMFDSVVGGVLLNGYYIF